MSARARWQTAALSASRQYSPQVQTPIPSRAAPCRTTVPVAQTLPPTFTTYFNLTSNNAAGVTGFAGLTVQALLRVQTGTFTSSSTYNNVQIDSGATLAGTNGTTINVSGNWTNNGTFTANTNTVNFNGSERRLSAVLPSRLSIT